MTARYAQMSLGLMYGRSRWPSGVLLPAPVTDPAAVAWRLYAVMPLWHAPPAGVVVPVHPLPAADGGGGQ